MGTCKRNHLGSASSYDLPALPFLFDLVVPIHISQLLFLTTGSLLYAACTGTATS